MTYPFFTYRQRRSTGLLLAGAAVILGTVPASAQDTGIVLMRKVIESRLDATLAPRPPVQTPPGIPNPADPASPEYFSWNVTRWTQSAGSCGSAGTETRDVACRNTAGLVAPDSRCAGNGSGPKPIGSRPATITATCVHSWQADEWPTPAGSCGEVIQRREVACLRSDGTPSDDCRPSTKPSGERTTYDVSGCGYGWSVSSWSAPSTSCGQARQTRSVSCRRTDGEQADEVRCTGDRPDTEQTTEQTSGCATFWDTGDWNTPAACGSVTESRSVVCRQANGAAVADDRCSDTRPQSTREGTDHSACPPSAYSWRAGEYGSPTTTCGVATLTRTVQCAFEDGSVVEDARCSGARPATTTERNVLSGCSYEWSADAEFGPAVPACGDTVRSRGVRCVRSDGQISTDTQCDAQNRPADTLKTTDHSACGYGWTASAWSAPSSMCGSATQTRTVACQRSDGSSAEDSLCDAGTKPATTQPSYQTDGCGLEWKTGEWEVPTPACGETTQMRRVSCTRSDGETLTDDRCAIVGTKPDETRASVSYAACTFSWNAGSYSAPSTTCGTATQTRTVSCRRSDGQDVGEESCAAAGTRPAATETTVQTRGCSYEWSTAAWNAPVPACGMSTHSRTVSCLRSDGTVSDPSACSGEKPTASEAVQDYSTCTYAWEVGRWKGSSNICGDTIQQMRDVTCRRSDESAVPDASCTTAKPAPSQTISDFSGCGYAWRTTSSAWSSTCSSSAKRTNASTCIRTDGVTVDDSFCGAKPPASETSEIYSGCTYTPTYSAFGACSSGVQSASMTSCQRSDGRDVPVGQCGSNPTVKTQGCGPTSCNAFQEGYTIQSYTNFRQVGTTSGYATFAQARTACEAVAGIGICYVDYYTASPYTVTATPYVAYVATTGTPVYFGYIQGKTIYVSRCTPK